MRRHPDPRTSAVAALLLLAVGGCVEKAERNGATRYGWSFAVPIFAVLAVVALLVGVWYLRRDVKRTAYLAAIFLICGIIFLPPFVTDHVIVDDEHFEVQHGPWFLRENHTVTFAEIKSLEIAAAADGQAKGPDLHIEYHTGQHKVLPHQSDMLTEAYPEIFQRAAGKGVKVMWPAKGGRMVILPRESAR